MKEVTIVCDGSSIGNGKKISRAAAAAILEYRGQRKIVGEYLGDGTISRRRSSPPVSDLKH